MMSQLTLIKWGAFAVLACACAGLCWYSVRTASLPGMSAVQGYVQRIDARLRRSFMPTNGAVIATAQAFAALIAIALGLALREPLTAAALPFIAITPHLYLKRLEAQRLVRIEAKVDAFTVALANALRATPNVARALATVSGSMPFPLNQELELTLRDLRVGSTLDQALSDLSARVGSMTLDTTISALLIGRRVGGNVPEILSETGASVREIARLQAVLRSKTADGRVQALVLGAFPVGVVIMFELLSPGYFAPLTQSVTGGIIAIAAGVFWIAALLLSRTIMRVEL